MYDLPFILGIAESTTNVHVLILCPMRYVVKNSRRFGYCINIF